jgi:transposase
MLRYAVPPGYQRQQPVKRPKLGPWLGAIDAIVEEDKRRPAKQRHTAKRIFERLRTEYAFSGGYTIVKDYVRTQKLRSQEIFVPLVHASGKAQADFGEALVVVAGVERRAHYLAMDLPHSDDGFVAAFPAETTEAFLESHVRAFALLWRRAHAHSLRQHEDRSGQDPGRRPAGEDTGLLGNYCPTPAKVKSAKLVFRNDLRVELRSPMSTPVNSA